MERATERIRKITNPNFRDRSFLHMNPHYNILLPKLHDPQVAITLLRMCGAYSKLVHLACSTPSDLVIVPMTRFDNDACSCFEICGGHSTN